MPTKVVSSSVMKGGGDGKHWTKGQIEAREQAEASAKRKKPKSINPPAALSPDARRVWDRIIESVKEIELFDNMDTELLEAYCEVTAKARALSKKQLLSVDDTKAYQAYLRLQKSLADSLGLSPMSRARLVKKKAEEIEDRFGKEFD